VDLEGGEYLISTTLRIPTYVSNMQIARGSLVANPKSAAWRAGGGAQQTLAQTVAPNSVAKAHACVSGFPSNRTGQWCQNLRPGPYGGSALSASLCREECCSLPSCNIWQWCTPGLPCAKSTNNISCWVSHESSYDPHSECSTAEPTQPKSVGWVGGSRPAVPAPPPTPWTGRFMIAVGGDVHCNHPQGSCNEAIGFPQLFLDGSRVANGIQVNSVMGTTIGPTTYLLNVRSFINERAVHA
jgi:hypothetical protein